MTATPRNTLRKRRGDHAGRRHARIFTAAPALIGVLLIGIAGPIAPAGILLPEIGDSSQTVLSSADAKELGEAFMRELRANVTVIEDPEVESYVQSLGYKLVSHTGQDNFNFTFFVVEQPGINAFAAPGGFVGINSGLITATESESELAAVLAHEVSHVTQHHIARFLELQSRATVPVIAGIIAAILIGTQNPQAGVAAAAAVQGSATQSLIDFTRDNEKEADRVGIQVLADAGLDPRAMPTFFERLQEASRYYQAPPEFLSTHPVTSNRIAESRERAEGYPYRQHEDSLSYHLVRAKLRVNAAATPQNAVEIFVDQLKTKKYLSLEGAKYGYALALSRAGAFDRARVVIDDLIERNPERVSYYAELARVEMHSGNLDEALFIYKDNLELYPQDRVLMRGYADALIRAGRPEQALRAFDRYAKYQPLDAVMHKYAARAHEYSGNSRGAHASLAEHYYVTGRLRRATHQLELAMRAPSQGDYIADAKIEARLQEFKEEEDLRAPK